MGQQILNYILDAEKLSLQAKMKFVMYIGMTTAEASIKPDSPETLQKCDEAFAKIKAEFQS